MDSLRHLASVLNYSQLPKATPDQSSITAVLTVVFGVTGSIALLIIVIAGFRYTIARDDPNAVAQARNTIIYALIGLVISLAAFSIVAFVVKGVG